MKRFLTILFFACMALEGSYAQKLFFEKSKSKKEGVTCCYKTIDGEKYCDVYMVGTTPDKFSSGLRRIVKDGKIGFIDKKGNIAILPQYDMAEPFRKKYCVVNKGAQKETVSATDAYSEGSMQGGLWGIIDKKGKTIIPCGFSKVWDENQHEFIYHNGTKGFQLTPKGKIIQTSKK